MGLKQRIERLEGGHSEGWCMCTPATIDYRLIIAPLAPDAAAEQALGRCPRCGQLVPPIVAVDLSG